MAALDPGAALARVAARGAMTAAVHPGPARFHAAHIERNAAPPARGSGRRGEMGKTGENTRPRRRGERKYDILSAAREAFSRKSYNEVTIALITSEVGIAKGTFYLYYHSKEDLFLEVIRDAAQRLRLALGAALEGLDDPLERVRVSVPVIFETCRREAGLYLAIFQRASFLDSEKLEEYNRLFEPLANDFQHTIEDGVRRGVFTTGNAEVLSHGVFGFLSSLIYRWLLLESAGGAPEGSFEEMAETVQRFFCFGLAGESFPRAGELGERRREMLERHLEEIRGLRQDLARMEGFLGTQLRGAP